MIEIHNELDLDQDGKQQGYLRVAHSVHRSAYGWIPVPIVSIKNGKGPTVLLMSGNHGDEYEGQVSLSRLVREIEAGQVNGQIIILTMANFPAAKAGLRTSPLDEGNLNRSFPGDPRGTPTQKIAHYIESELLSRADFLFDLHSGGSSLEYRPTLIMQKYDDPEVEAINRGLRDSLGFPNVLIVPESRGETYSGSGAFRQNAIPITAEMAGGGTINHAAVNLLNDALERYLNQIGVLTTDNKTTPQHTALEFDIPSNDYYIFADREGIFEPLVTLNDNIKEGQHVGTVHFPERPWDEPQKLISAVDANVLCKRIPARTQHGDCLFQLGKPCD